MTDKEAKDKISKVAGMYTRESIRNYENARANGSTPRQAFDFVKNDLKKRQVNI